MVGVLANLVANSKSSPKSLKKEEKSKQSSLSYDRPLSDKSSEKNLFDKSSGDKLLQSVKPPSNTRSRQGAKHSATDIFSDHIYSRPGPFGI
jgi:hypothetical protein